MVARGETPVFTSRLPLEELARLDKLAVWLHETRGFPKSRRVAIEYLLDFWESTNES